MCQGQDESSRLLTGLYFFFVTKVKRGVSEGEEGRSGCNREYLSEPLASCKVLVQGSRPQASKWQRAISVQDGEGRRQENDRILGVLGDVESVSMINLISP